MDPTRDFRRFKYWKDRQVVVWNGEGVFPSMVQWGTCTEVGSGRLEFFFLSPRALKCRLCLFEFIR